jgi:hypothetical protein
MATAELRHQLEGRQVRSCTLVAHASFKPFVAGNGLLVEWLIVFICSPGYLWYWSS